MTHPKADESAARTKRELKWEIWLSIKHLHEKETIVIVQEQGHIQPGKRHA